MSKKINRLLLVFAHPDDETFTCGNLISWYGKLGYDIRLVCATPGDKGEGGIYGQVTPSELSKIRKSELETAGGILGIKKIEHLDFEDSKLSQIAAGTLEDIIYQSMIRFLPHIVVTFDPVGITNHPDHKRISRSTSYAYQKYAAVCEKALEISQIKFADENNKFSQIRKNLRGIDVQSAVFLTTDPFKPKLYYACIPESVIKYLVSNGNMSAVMFDKPVTGTPDDQITHIVDHKSTFKNKILALQVYQSQKVDVENYLNKYRLALRDREYYILRMDGMDEVIVGKNDRIMNRL